MSATTPEIILVVDDNDIGRYNKTRILKQSGFSVAEAASGSEALTLIEQVRPRLVLLDVKLPDIDGWEICRRIKASNDTAWVLVLQMSATFITEADTVRALEGGADGCLTEPVEPPVLVATVRALLRARQAEDALRESLVREQAARTAAESANRSKDEFLATLSHELRSPIGVVLTWVSLLRAGQLDESRMMRALEAIERNTRLQAKMVEDLLDVSRIISGKMRLELGLVELSTVIRAALESVRPAAEAKGIRIESILDPTLGPVAGDAARLQQVAWNLLSNAVKFTPKGGRVEIRTEGLDSTAQITVTDSGRGIEPEFLPHVFERFRQADATSTRAEGGLGLGLAIVRHLVELHGGTVEAQSEGVGKGAKFMFRLPLPAVRMAVAHGGHGNLKYRVPEVELPSLAGVRILVVDDETDAREAITLVLQQCGAQTLTAASVAEARGAMQTSLPDVLVSDIAMPFEDGYALIAWLRQRDAIQGRTVPALALTAYAGADDEGRILAAGYQAYLTKPIDVTRLATAVARLARTQS